MTQRRRLSRAAVAVDPQREVVRGVSASAYYGSEQRPALPLRPMLGAVLDALAAPRAGDPLPSYWCDVPPVVRDSGDVVVVGSPYHSVRYPWLTDPAEAWEMLQARGLIPMEYVGRFVCEDCGGSGKGRFPSITTEELARGETWFRHRPCRDCTDGHVPHPPTVAALASWLSLGWAASDDGRHPGICGAEELAREIGGDVRWGTGRASTSPASAFGAGSPMARLTNAGIGWAWAGGMVDRTTLHVPPLGGG